ncbi:TPR-REGION domain-containing protein [Mycena indigotica]|uniref:TPR-REGION domain-containing protein n=1 Tax=Mycena indigotica TaxID=2126181 RepID=A0A8H6SWR1_9AGAR|nr:TPR-REGION domain-containing protein [Mycena indigotica]KAF7307363.1 TPR-REGION domain-containing protein [Mycena indigotica]
MKATPSKFKETNTQRYNKYSNALVEDCDAQTPVIFKLYTNRAACSSKLSRHFDALMDAQESVKLDSTCSKGYLKAALAAEDLRYWATAEEVCNTGLSTLDDPTPSKPVAWKKKDLPWLTAAALAHQDRLRKTAASSSRWTIA